MRFPGNPVNAILQALPAVLAAAALAAPASAATLRIQAGGGGGGGGCSGFDQTSSTPLIAVANCGGPNGGANGVAAAALGSVGVEARVVAIGPQPVNLFTQASFQDSVIFTSIDPAATQADVALTLVLHGLLANQGASQPRLAGGGSFGGSPFDFVLQRSASTNTSYTGLNLLGGTLNDPNTGLTFAILATPLITVTLGAPIDISIALQASTFAIGSGNFGSVAFANTFEIPIGSNAFQLPPGVTANAGTWLVNNRRIDPNAVAVPEPAAWALMICGFGMAGGMLRRKRHAPNAAPRS